MSHVTCHVSRVTCPMSHVIFFFFFFGRTAEAYRWRVCYQRGLPRLVYITYHFFFIYYMYNIKKNLYHILMHSYKKKCIFPHVRNFTLIYGPYSCLIDGLLALYWWTILFFFSNAPSIFKLLLCNLKLTKLDILTLLGSDCRAWALKLSEDLKTNKPCFCLHFVNSNLK